MAKKKTRNKKTTEKLKTTMKYELIGLIILGLSAIAIAKLGVVGHAVVSFVRFFMGEWYILLLLGSIVIGFYLMIKREVPYFFKRQLVGLYFIIASILLLSHVTLFQLLAEGGPFKKPSVILNTWELFWMEVSKASSTEELGGGMIGALLFATSYFLFDAAGSKIISFIFIVIGMILLTGKTLGDTLGTFFTAVTSFLVKQWKAFTEDLKVWGNERKEKKKKNHLSRRKKKKWSLR